MSLRLKANLLYALAVLLLLAAALALRGGGGSAQSVDAARREAALLTAQAGAVGQYTREKIAPLLEASGAGSGVFLPESVPFYASDVVARDLAHAVPGDTLRRVALDPGDASERPDADERAMIDRFRGQTDPAPFTVRRNGPDGSRLVLVTPLLFAPGACATCYVSRAAAPKGLLDVVGSAKGFDDKPGEVVGALIASVPLVAEPGAGQGDVLAWLVVASAMFWALLNVVLEYLVLRPLGHVASVAEQVSLGAAGIPEFGPAPSRELGVLTRSFNRLRRSMESAIGLIEP